MAKQADPGIYLDLDRQRIRDVLSETYRIAAEVLETEFNITSEEFASKIEPFLGSNRVSLPVFINLPSRLYPDLKIEVNLRRQKVFARIPARKGNHPKQVLLNHHIKVL